MKNTFIVAWTGGYEVPSFYVTTDRESAEKTFQEWAALLKEDNGDQVDMLEVVFIGDGVLSQEVTKTAYTNVEDGEVVFI